MKRPGGPLLALLLSLPLAGGPAGAQPVADAQPSAPSAALGGAQARVDLQAEYVQDVPLIVPITLLNPTAQTLRLADLSARPWLVRFDLVLPDGRSVRRATTPPDADSGRTVPVPPGGQRRTLLQIPGAETTPAGSYRLDVQLIVGDSPVLLGSGPIKVAAPRPVGGDLGLEGLAGSKAGLQAVWLHRASAGFDLYLHQASTADPRVVEEQRHLVHLDAERQPWLAASRASDARSPAVAWAEGDRSLRVHRVDATGAVMADLTVELPWPRAELVGRPAVLTGGTVLVPLWVPAPAGAGGELRLASIDSRGRPGFPRLARFDTRPASLETTVTAEGAGLFLISHSGGLDLYTLRAGAPQGPAALPVPGKRLWTPGDGGALRHASFELLPDTDALAGGLAVLMLQESEGGLGGRWLDLQGNTRLTLPITAGLPPGELAAVAPGGAGYPGLLMRSGSTGTYVEGPARLTLPGLAAKVSLVRDADGVVVLRQLGAGAPVTAKQLLPVAP